MANVKNGAQEDFTTRGLYGKVLSWCAHCAPLYHLRFLFLHVSETKPIRMQITDDLFSQIG